METKNMLRLTINGQQTEATPGTTVMEAARGLGIEIPSLCYHAALPPEGSCRICIVEMSITKRGKDYTWIDAACVYPVEEGLQVRTDSEKVIRQRKLILELLLSRAPHAETLLKLAARYGARADRFEAYNKGTDNCILCGLCIRVCNNLLHTGGIGAAFRGVYKKIVSPLGVAADVCTGCTACSLVCPTGAIKVIESKAHMDIPAWDTKLEMQCCSSCGRAYAPVRLLKEISSRVYIQAEVLNKCPACRQKVFREARKS